MSSSRSVAASPLVSRVVLDASALLALLNGETGADAVARAIPGAVISSVNLSEVIAKLADAGMPEREVHEALDPLGLGVIPFDETLAYLAGTLRPATRSLGLSLGDRACLALGMHAGAAVLTTERAWTKLSLGIPIHLAR